MQKFKGEISGYICLKQILQTHRYLPWWPWQVQVSKILDFRGRYPVWSDISRVLATVQPLRYTYFTCITLYCILFWVRCITLVNRYDRRWCIHTCTCILPKLPAVFSRFFYFFIFSNFRACKLSCVSCTYELKYHPLPRVWSEWMIWNLTHFGYTKNLEKCCEKGKYFWSEPMWNIPKLWAWVSEVKTGHKS